jgi:hypothetical protein
MDTRWGPDVFDSSYVESVKPMVFEKYARVPKEFSTERKSKETRLVLNPLWAWRGFSTDPDGQMQASYQYDDQICESYYFNLIDEIRSGYGSARCVFVKAFPDIESKRGITEAYVEELLNFAKPGMSPKELHEGVIDKVAEGFLKKKFKKYLSNMDVNHNSDMERTMLNIAKNIRVFNSAEKDFERVLSHVFAESMFSYIPKCTT